MKAENRQYLEYTREELESYYNGEYEGEEVSLYDYFDDVLDLEYTVSSNREYLGVKIWITIGGPSVWIDTRNACLELRWGGESDTLYISRDLAEAIDDIFEEFYSI